MAFELKNHPFPITSCGRRRSFMMTDNPIKLFDSPNKNVEGSSNFLQSASILFCVVSVFIFTPLFILRYI